MSASSGEKSQGRRFAEQQMHKHGWTEGKGLGRRENGISEAIKVKVKCDHAGVGHNSAEQFTFHWWDHVFNKTASSISVEADQDGVKVNRTKDDDAPVTNKKPRKALSNRNMLYGRFVKSATLLPGGEQAVKEPSSSESSDSSGDEDEKLDLSSATKMTDEDLRKVCGGRTAHKGARHGLTMSAKLSRLEEQEREFLAKYGNKQQKDKVKAVTPEITEDLLGKNRQQNDSGECPETNNSHKKKKKKRERVDSEREEEEEEESQENRHEEEQVPLSEEEIKSSKKKKSKKKHREQSASPQEEQVAESTDFCIKPKKKKKKKNKSE
ncbi:hypothetical protein XENTR_v10022480 [Xenopus tropicalis]|uniref:G patch domain-containing protein 4 isoform X1 n=1 Tax=Xenopus tropicalis TaxID=8364 RepID=UPI00006A0A13|nr:G patch domain-containing protein 4 isoform X1 [Xenopus tropicalis]KAE8588361.1 hypothetical protein XENTR_v10022480 [Xenopus tropicalis]KAE8588362.1 hypothetical protein XENTR_v10022480 [Xenopus tropicalis]CAJ82002.1 Novel protein containing G-patch domain [Xenopus tropicalis]|eukprot:XP_012808646.1 PREDICTED: G patch domain-containing protein 4 isoform X1 [Xenopus tropicalis]